MIWIRSFIGHLLFYIGILAIILGVIGASDLELFGLTADLVTIAKLVVVGSAKYASFGFGLALIGRLLIPAEALKGVTMEASASAQE
jgi:hypothetical protein